MKVQMYTPRLTGVLLTISLLFGCRSVGREFSSERVGDLRLGETSEAQVREWFGEPGKTTTHNESEPHCEIAYYQFGHGNPKGGVSRVLAVELLDGKVNAWLFDSSMQADSTRFLSEDRQKLVPGESTRSDVTRQLGDPTGRGRLPSKLVAEHLEQPPLPDATEVWLWRYTEIDRHMLSLRSVTSLLGLTFDADGLLLQSEYRGPGK